jgi:hypothetical protein
MGFNGSVCTFIQDAHANAPANAIILTQGPLEQSGVLQKQSGYTSEQLAFSGDRTDIRVAPSARIRCRSALGGLLYAGADNRMPELASTTCRISGEVVYLPSALSALSAYGVWRRL